MSARKTGTDPIDLGALLKTADPGAVLVAVVNALIDRRLDERLGSRPVERFTSEALPPRTSRRAFAEHCRSGKCVGAVLVGKIWECPASSWWEARGHRPEPKPALRLVKTGVDVDALVEKALRRGGRA
jgi:hypothetical protein